MGLELVESSSGLVVARESQGFDGSSFGTRSFEFTYLGAASEIWFHACAVEGEEEEWRSCLADDDTEAEATRIMDQRDRLNEGCGCGTRGRVARGWPLLAALLLVLPMARRMGHVSLGGS